MPKSFGPAIKNRALELYLPNDKSAREIAELLWEEFEVDVKPTTIYMWARENNWDDDKEEVKAQAIQHVKESSGQRIARLQEEHADEYTRLREKAARELHHLGFDKASEAAKALDLGIRGERQIMEGMINLQFVQNVLNVLVEEISEEDVLKKIATRLRALIQTEETAVI